MREERGLEGFRFCFLSLFMLNFSQIKFKEFNFEKAHRINLKSSSFQQILMIFSHPLEIKCTRRLMEDISSFKFISHCDFSSTSIQIKSIIDNESHHSLPPLRHTKIK